MSGVRDRQAEWFRGPHRVELIVLCEMQWRVVNVHWDRRLIYADFRLSSSTLGVRDESDRAYPTALYLLVYNL